MEISKGKVYLVGAGCGSKDLITLRGLKLIQTCDALVYDDLIDEALLNEAPKSADKIYMGKRLGKHSALQNEIEEMLIKLANEGKTVVRLKGGDPFVFGRGGEEALALNNAGISWQVVPGISSSIAIPELAGIPVTHRKISRSFHVITGHTAGDNNLDEDFSSLSKLKGTLVFLMGLSNIEKICDSLIKFGKDPFTPAAVISGGNSPNPVTIKGTLSTISKLIRENSVLSPAIIVIGETVGLNLFSNSNLPLYGVNVGLTGTDSTNSKLQTQLEALGANACVSQRILIKELPFSIDSLSNKKPHWLVFTSANGVRVFFDKLRELKVDLRNIYNCKFAVIGTATKKALENYGIYADICPSVFTSVNLAQDIIENISSNEDVLLFRALNASKDLPKMLKAAGISFSDIPIYDIIPDESGTEINIENIDYLIFASAGGVEMFFEKHGHIPNNTKCVCIGEITANSLRAHYNKRFLVSKIATCESIAEAILDDYSNKQEELV